MIRIVVVILIMTFIRNVSTAACSHGYYGTNCTRKCPSHCTACNNEKECTECEQGYYSGFNDGRTFTHTCMEQCDPSCLTCNLRYDICTQCIEGRYKGHEFDIPDNKNSTDCIHQCRSNCTKCISYNQCTECKDGYFGPQCAQRCPHNCTTCHSNGSCAGTCIKGTFGQYCNQTCRFCKNNNCQPDGKCSEGCTAGHYGTYCNQMCSTNCQKHCDKDGKCKGCKGGYFGDVCNETCSDKCSELKCKIDGRCYECKIGFHGSYCQNQCSELCPRRLCNKSNGTCLNDSKGMSTTKSEVVTFQYESKTVLDSDYFSTDGEDPGKDSVTEQGLNLIETPANFPLILLIVSIVGGTLFIVVISVILVVVIKQRRSKRHNKKHSTQQSTTDNSRRTVDTVDQEMLKEDDKQNASEDTRQECELQNVWHEDEEISYHNIEAISRATNVKDLPMVIQHKDELARDFRLLPNDLLKPFTDSQKAENFKHNRYRGVFPYNFNRVKLKEVENDYINASYIDGYGRQKAYIAALGPTKKTTSDFELFWHMVWQECVEKIVMLTNLMEEGGKKCEMYWPENGNNEIYGDIMVSCMEEKIYTDYTLRTFHITKLSSATDDLDIRALQNSKSRTARHFHYTVWPDKSVPSDITSLIDLRERVLHAPSEFTGPVLIHCSAGVGRTGTYIALDILAQQGKHEDCVDILNCVRDLRQQRVNMVQTVEQYQYLHDVVAYVLTVQCEPVQADQYEELMRDSSSSHLHHIYEKMQKIDKLYTKVETDAIKRHQMLVQVNREGADIPGDENRPRLFMDRNHGSSDYINAVYINGLTVRNRYIIAQTPLDSTVKDFLTLIFQENCSVVVDMDSFQDQTTGRYLPKEGETLEMERFKVSTSALENSAKISYGKLSLSYNRKHSNTENHVVHIYRYGDWDDNRNVPNSPTHFLQFVKEIESIVAEDAPAIVHCRNGAERSGLVCAVAVILQKLDTDRELSITNTVKQIQARRPLAIPNKEQYVFCHQVATEYLRTFHTYANFEQIA